MALEKLRYFTSITYVRLLQDSINSESLTEVRQAHAHLIANGYTLGVFLGNRLIDMYVKCGSIVDACHVFDKMLQRDVSTWNSLITGYTKIGKMENARQLFVRMPRRDVVSWTAMISGYDQHGRCEEALRLFLQMGQGTVKPNQFTYASSISSCASRCNLNMGNQIHGHVVRSGFEGNVFVGSALIDLYAKCGELEDARQVFDKMPLRNVVSWTTLMVAYAQSHFGEETLKLFCEIQRTGDVKQDRIILVSVLIACGSLGELLKGRMVHGRVVISGFHGDDFVGNALVDMYAKCGALRDSQQIFEGMCGWDVVSWTALIGGYVHNGYSEEALRLFWKMLWTDAKPNEFTFANALSACGNLVLMDYGKQLHAHVIEGGYESHVSVANSLVTVYTKCGSIDDAAQVFDSIGCKDLVSWNAMIGGYAHNGNGQEALQIFEMMLEAGMKPDQITLLNVLSACSHAGLVDEGCHLFYTMRREHNVMAAADHYACMIDLLGRAGRMREAKDIVNNLPVEPDVVVWKALLGACRIHGNVELGELAAQHLIQLDPESSSTYVLLSNVYAAANMWNEAAKVRKMMKERGVKKEAGWSWIQIKNKVYTFVAEDASDQQSEGMQEMVKGLAGQMTEASYASDIFCVA